MGAIDYTGRADAFRRRRTLPPAVLEAWRAAVTPRLGSACRHLVDVGAGTGQFCVPLARWAGEGARVTALEPSAAMRAELVDAGADAAVRVVAARAEALPLTAGSVDAAWLSTVVHQLADLDAALAELYRVLRPGGRVLVRGYFADQGPVSLLGHFPGIARPIARFPTGAELISRFARAGFAPLGTVEVAEDWDLDLRDWAATAMEIRHADSMLAPLTDDEVAGGLASIRAEAERRPGARTPPLPLRLMTFRRP